MTSTTSPPSYKDILSKMEYANDSTDANKLNAIYEANPSLLNLPADAVDANARNCSTSDPVDFLYLHTIRGGRKMSSGWNGGCGCSGSSGSSGMKGGSGNGSGNGYTGGCFTCPKGVKNIVRIYGTIHVVIPSLYKKYKMAKPKKAIKK